MLSGSKVMASDRTAGRIQYCSACTLAILRLLANTSPATVKPAAVIEHLCMRCAERLDLDSMYRHQSAINMWMDAHTTESHKANEPH